MCQITTTPEWTDIATAIGTVALAIIAWVQLSKLNASYRISSLMAVLDQEKELKNRKTLMDDTAFTIRELTVQNPLPVLQLQLLQSKLEIEVENYLNSIDRLAYCIKNDYFPERDWKREYRGLFTQVAQTFPDKFSLNSPYINFIDLQEKWRRK
jgi:hypothetical protein